MRYTYYKIPKTGDFYSPKTPFGPAYRFKKGAWIRAIFKRHVPDLIKVTAKEANGQANKTLVNEIKDGTL